jgi:hypothetical protein
VPELVIQELGADMARARAAGLALSSDGASGTTGNTRQAQPPAGSPLDGINQQSLA